jgi:hypothetical protein
MSAKGNAILLRARQQLCDARTVEKLRKVHVPEWETDIFYWPTRDLPERLAVEQYIKFGTDRTMADLRSLHIANVVARARDEMGNRLFSDEDADALGKTPQTVVEQISVQIGLGDGLTVEVAEKN